MSSIDSASSKWDAYKGTAKRELDAARETLLTSAEIADKEYLQPATQILVSFSKTKPLLLAFIIILALFSLVPISLFFIFSATSVATLLFGALALAMILIGSASLVLASTLAFTTAAATIVAFWMLSGYLTYRFFSILRDADSLSTGINTFVGELKGLLLPNQISPSNAVVSTSNNPSSEMKVERS